MNKGAIFAEERTKFHAALMTNDVLVRDAKGVPSNADGRQRTSIRIAEQILERIGNATVIERRLVGQRSGNLFESICADFIRDCFSRIVHLRPGDWAIQHVRGRNGIRIAEYEQYAHLIALDSAAKKDPELAAALGSDYTISPDIVVVRQPLEDDEINAHCQLVDDKVATYASLRKRFNPKPILHASISCKWTMRSDRAQNARSEGLNLVRNRKGRLPHVMVVVGEPSPSRIASIALGTGDIDCVYHFALSELQAAVADLGLEESQDLLDTMVGGMRLRDISDLPLDLAV